VDATGAEELEGADLAELPPRVAVGREVEALGVAEHELQRRPHGPRGEVNVVGVNSIAPLGHRSSGYHLYYFGYKLQNLV
jgi:hypothetical protein